MTGPQKVGLIVVPSRFPDLYRQSVRRLLASRIDSVRVKLAVQAIAPKWRAVRPNPSDVVDPAIE